MPEAKAAEMRKTWRPIKTRRYPNHRNQVAELMKMCIDWIYMRKEGVRT
jgi:hypothetical protein